MSFMSSLAANPAGGSGVYGQPGPSNPDDALGIVRQLKDREMEDFKNKAGFMSDLSIKQDRLRRLYGLDGSAPQGQGNADGSPNVVMGQDPNQMTGFQKGELGVRQQQIGQEQQKTAQAGKLGQESIDIKSQQEKLSQQKSDQINAQKTADMQRKVEDANQKIELAKQALDSKNTNAEAALEAHKNLAAAMEERHKLELAQKDRQFSKVSEQHDKQIKDMEQKIKDARNKTTTTEVNAEGNKKTTTTKSGDATNSVNVTGKDGKTYWISADKLDDWNAKLDDWNANHAGDANAAP
jgi:hypothetical protein